MVLSFVCICGFAGVIYYTLLQDAQFTMKMKPHASVEEVSLTEYLSLSQQQLELAKKERVHLVQVESPARETTVRSLVSSTKPTDPTIAVVNSEENLETFTLNKPSKEKILKLETDDKLDEKFLRNDERSIETIVDGQGDHQSTLSDEVFRKLGLLKKRLPFVIIIGVKKGGTRALLEMLKLHPKICACGPEMHYFDRYYSKGFEWYRDKMPLCYDNEITVEKTPSYFVTSGVAGDMFTYSKSLNHTLKLLVIVRDPTTRAISDYTQTVYRSRNKKFRKLYTFEQLALTNNSEGTKVVNSRWGAIKIGVYSKHLRRWLNYFKPGQIHVVSGENLIKEPYGEIKRVERFLGLSSFIRTEHFVYNKTKGFYCFDRNLSYRNEVITTTVPLRCLGTTKGRSHVKISEHAERLLREYYRPFNEELYRMVQKNFGWH